MKLRVKDMNIATGGSLVVILNEDDARTLDLHHGDRLRLKNKSRQAVAILDIAESKKAVKKGHIGLFEEVLDALKAVHKDDISISLEEKPLSLHYIKKKLNGMTLSGQEINHIVQDIVDNKLSDIELTYFVAACHTNTLTNKETTALTKAMIHNGEILKIKGYPVIDKHCAGGIAGNRTTMIVVPIIATTGLIMPKTSSRSITSPAGTADAMEILAPVSFSIKKVKAIVKKTNACIVWGGAINLAPADDKIIRVEHPLSIDTRSQLLASIIAKKASVSATHVLVDLPVGKYAKIQSIKAALDLKKQFEAISKEINMKIRVVITDASQPIGNGLGPALEARDVLKVLMYKSDAPKDLLNKSVRLAGEIFEMIGMCKKGHGQKKALDILKSGAAMKKMKEIIKAQGGNQNIMPGDIKLGRFRHDIISEKTARISHIDNSLISKIARLSGAPNDKGAGIYLYKHKKDSVKKGEKLFTIYSNNKQRLKFALGFYRKFGKMAVA